jgi:hypothetical protein
LPQQGPVSTATGKAGHISALIPADFVVRPSGQSPATKGMEVNFGDAVKSAETGRVRMVLADGSILNLGSSSQITVTQNNKQTGETVVNLTAGRVRSQVVHLVNPQGQWTVRTNTAICGVLGTDFDVQVFPDKTILTVFKGKVRFTPIGQRITSAAVSGAVTVVAGQTSTAAAGAVAAPVSSGVSSASSAVASTAISSQGASAAGNAAIAASRVGVVGAGAAPAAASAAVVAAATASNSADGGTSNTSNITTTTTTVVSQSHP